MVENCCKQVTDSAVKEISEHAQMSGLTCLNLRGLPITDDALGALSQLPALQVPYLLLSHIAPYIGF